MTARGTARVSSWLIGSLLLSLAVLATLLMHDDLSIARLLLRPADRHQVFPGFTVENAPVPSRGLIITSLQSNCQASREGARVGDLLIAIDGRPVADLRQAVGLMLEDPDNRVALKLLHEGRARTIIVSRIGGRINGT
ncbi:MAG: protease [Rhizorhabdus sp.]|nr:protease [Rhizorhabdus sp.]